jgi:hypothetical protein
MRQFARQFLFSLPVGIAFTDLVASVVRVDGASMQPTLNPDGSGSCDWVLVDKFSVKIMHKYRRGDVVILWCAAWRAPWPPCALAALRPGRLAPWGLVLRTPTPHARARPAAGRRTSRASR